MTKKEFIEQSSFHQYGRSYKAIYCEFRTGEGFRGFKYCVWGRTCDITKKDLVDTLFKYINGKITDADIPWYITLAVAKTDQQRFKAQIVSSGLYKLPNIN